MILRLVSIAVITLSLIGLGYLLVNTDVPTMSEWRTCRVVSGIPVCPMGFPL